MIRDDWRSIGMALRNELNPKDYLIFGRGFETANCKRHGKKSSNARI